MNILIGKPEHCSSSSSTVWRAKESKLTVSHGYFSSVSVGNNIPFWTIYGCILDISIDIALDVPEYLEMDNLFSDPEDVNEKIFNEYVTRLILKYITPEQFITAIENESTRQFYLGQQDKVDEIRRAVSKLGFRI